jgi:hypothetical protein
LTEKNFSAAINLKKDFQQLGREFFYPLQNAAGRRRRNLIKLMNCG